MHISCHYKSVVSCCDWLKDHWKYLGNQKNKKVGMQLNFIAAAPCSVWSGQITRDRKPAKINRIEMHRLKLKVWTIQKKHKRQKEAQWDNPAHKRIHSGEDDWLLILIANARGTVTGNAVDCPQSIYETAQGTSGVTLQQWHASVQ